MGPRSEEEEIEEPAAGVVKTFIHHNGALGDVLLSLPCIRAAKEESGLVHLAGRADVVSLLRDTGCVDEVSSSDSRRYASLYGGRDEGEASAFLSGFDRSLIFSARGNSELSSAVARLIPRTKTILTIPPPGIKEHAAEFRLKQLAGSCALPVPLMEIPPTYGRQADDILDKTVYPARPTIIIGLHYGSGGKDKCWAVENYLALAKRISRHHDSALLIFSGPAEDRVSKEKIEDFTRWHSNVFPVRDRELVLVAALLSRCVVFVGNDSGTSHLAGAVNTRVIALFGPTDPEIWRPLGNKVRVISPKPPGSSLSGITVGRVYEAVADILP